MLPVKVLVVDDSSLMRRLISRLLEGDREIKVIGTAADGLEALQQIKNLKPDVVTLDVEMPKLDGIATLRRLMKECPTPTVMLSAHTHEGARATMDALSAGAVDFVPKPATSAELPRMVEELKAKIKVASRVVLRRVVKTTLAPAGSATPPRRPALAPRQQVCGKIDLVVIGCSTGGPAALQQIIPYLPADLPAGVVIVQHIPVGFSKSMAEHLDKKSALAVRHAESGDAVKPGLALVAPAGYDLNFVPQGSGAAVSLSNFGQPLAPGGFRPSVDWVMQSAAEVYGCRALGVLLTGMGRDGARGMLAIKEQGGPTIAEHESTCVVYGMPRAAVELGAAQKVVPLPQIAQEIQRFF
ncbi:protein-glutamate methylesterase/protein-glutamine glutaminase [Desulforamulus hydrothermalis]|uniref:Protein-glutamate methylesterase/protein-glutamine glutaminase n=1 Tax=Desulforamulus hydrothermalis Lam5 = DSM 18033 TaxID=1121428 RepID=K8E0K9_9FIRM|nr:chemotaxis response regulator protein-glutamate methylesterase [Desulforamulus hydrothermalis]CCO09139.1 Chemotaxis response regulator CheB [Desulforamulus hydrothermalis Lam5 = DSM 18033]SHH11833.1 two-component system, chemotaxis family, response regulator CheB [Desulforamulus hydrothermalis Lam5 = DSM 18033]